MKQSIVLCLVLTLLSPSLPGQTLPRGMTAAEELLVRRGHVYPETPSSALLANGFPDAPRTMAEWEELEALVITWAAYPHILREIVRAAREEVRVLIVTRNASDTRTYLEAGQVDLSSNVEFVEADFNTIWVRDYGGNPVYMRDVDSLVFVDWIYNRPRPKDDLVPFVVAEYLNLPIYSTSVAPFDLVNTGGNFMSDGRHRGFASELVLTENGPAGNFGFSDHTEAEIDSIMDLYMGIGEYVKMTVLPFDGIHHIDMHMKLLDESTLLVGEYPQGIADGPQIEANLMSVVEQFKQQTGRDYQIVRIPMPPDKNGRYPPQGDYRTYTNAVFVNRTILIPGYDLQYDTTALRIWDEVTPGYRKVMIPCDDIIALSGALHCITKEVGVRHPLWISHFQPGEVTSSVPVPLTATMKHVTGILEAWLFYRSDMSAPFDSVQMVIEGDDDWVGQIPLPLEPTRFQYYFKGIANSGKVTTKPLPAPEGYHILHVTPESSSATFSTNSRQEKVSIAPNPTDGQVVITLSGFNAGTGAIVIRDMSGRFVREVYHGQISGNPEIQVHCDLSQLAPGPYLVEAKSGFHCVLKVMIIQ